MSATSGPSVQVEVGASGRWIVVPMPLEIPAAHLLAHLHHRVHEREKVPPHLQVLRTGEGGVLLTNNALHELVRGGGSADGDGSPKLHLSLAREWHPTALTCRLKLSQLLGGGGVVVDVFPMAQSSSLSAYSVFHEVCKRGGAAQVSAERKWTDVAQALHCAHWSKHAGAQIKQKFEDLGMQRVFESFPEFALEELLNYASQEAGARQASLPSRAMTPMELRLFPEFTPVFARERYLCCRDHVLQRWCVRCDEELVYEEHVRADLQQRLLGGGGGAQWAEWDAVLRLAFFALETLGYFNWGCMKDSSGSRRRMIGGSAQRRIVVMGAGLAGLSCALQLARFGHRVDLVEARNRAGGRVYSDLKSFSSPVDLGAMLITGVSGHPASVLTHQLRQKKYSVGEQCPIYSLGAKLDPGMDEKIEHRFNQMLTAAAANAGATPPPPPTTTTTTQTAAAATTATTPSTEEPRRKRGRPRKHPLPAGAAGAPTTAAGAAAAAGGAAAGPPPSTGGSYNGLRLSKYSGVVWSAEKQAWLVTLTRRDTGATEWIDDDVLFAHELDAALAHDAELDRRRTGAVYCDSHNQTRYPGDFIADRAERFAKRQRELMASLHDSSTYAEPAPGAAHFGAQEEEEGAREADAALALVQQLQASAAAIDAPAAVARPSPQRDDFSLMDRMLEFEDDSMRTSHEDVAKLESTFLSWHFANLEYACATSLEHISNANWDQDDEHDWEGAHVLLPNGFGVITEAMRRKLGRQPGCALHMNKPVQHVRYGGSSGGSGVVIECQDGTSLQGDAVVCTVSLGVLKDSMRFSPALPAWKQASISRLGYGNLNKIVLEFPSVFWNAQLDIFGRVVHPETGSARGECYMFWALNRMNPHSAVLLALVAGDAANEQELRSDQECVSRAVAALRETFPNVPDAAMQPTASAVTRWRSDPYARGSYSYVSVGSNGDDYELLAESVNDEVFFAGEATCRDHPATTGGALVSGLREAAKLASLFGRTTTLRDEGDDGKLVNVLRRIRQATKLVCTLDEHKKQVVAGLMHAAQHEQFGCASDVWRDEAASVARAGGGGGVLPLTATWTHQASCGEAMMAAVDEADDRERLWRAKDIAKRLPVLWTDEQRRAYLVQRLGPPRAVDSRTEDVGFWV